MESRSFYVYALKDPRSETAGIFYIGKGQGHRKTDHVLQLDDSAKSRRIGQIRTSGLDVVLEELVSGITENDALRIEAELIATFGTQTTGGVLLNQVLPTGGPLPTPSEKINVPTGLPEKAAIARKLLEDSILAFVSANENGVRNIDVARWLECEVHMADNREIT